MDDLQAVLKKLPRMLTQELQRQHVAVSLADVRRGPLPRRRRCCPHCGLPQ